MLHQLSLRSNLSRFFDSFYSFPLTLIVNLSTVDKGSRPLKTRLIILMLVTSSLSLSSNSAAIGAETLMPIDDTGSVWIVGTDTNGYSCWSLSSTKSKPTLQVKVRSKWITKAKAKLSKNSSICEDSEYPWVATYNWIVDELGETPHSGTKARDLMAREYLPKSGNTKSFTSAPFVKQVYASKSAHASALGDVLNEFLGGGSSGSSYGSSSKFAGCTFKGKKLYGKVQVVDYFPDIRVQIVDYFPDLKVQSVDYFPTSCGKWQFVDYFPDIKIQFVDYFPDVKIQYVDYFPGLP